MTHQVDAIDVYRIKKSTNVLNQGMSFIPGRWLVRGALTAAAESHDMEPIRKIRSEGVESMGVNSETWQQQNDGTLPALIEVLESDPIDCRKLIIRLALGG